MRKAVLFVAVLVAVSVHGNSYGQTTISFVSDASWETFAMNPDGSQGASLGAPQFPSWAIHGASYPGASWMWYPGVNESSLSDLKGAFFSKQLNLAGVPVGGLIQIAVDDFAEVAINGAVAGSTGSITDHGAAATAQGSLKDIDLTPYLVSGTNTITIKAQNGPYWFSGFGCNPCTYAPTGNPAGVVFGGSLSFIPVTPALRASWGRVKSMYR